jgi:hypothetical protein
MLALAAKGNFAEYRDKTEQLEFPFWDETWDELDIGGGCGDSCEIGTDTVDVFENTSVEDQSGRGSENVPAKAGKTDLDS